MGYGDRPAGSRPPYFGGFPGLPPGSGGRPALARGAQVALAAPGTVGYESPVGEPEIASASAVVCVLGCRPGSPALARRARAARDAFVSRKASLVLTCGGPTRGGRVEADVLAEMLQDGGVPESAIVRERLSRDTQENAVGAARILRERGRTEVVVVTCSWHVPRARRLFERAGLRVVAAVGAEPPDPSLFARAWWPIRERVALAKDVLLG